MAEDAPYELGMLRMTDGGDVAVFATGTMVHTAIEAAGVLATKGRKILVVNVGCVKPLDTHALFEILDGVKHAVTIEEHSVIGGLGSAICGALSEKPIPVTCIGIDDRFGCSAQSHAELLEHYGLTSKRLVECIDSIA